MSTWERLVGADISTEKKNIFIIERRLKTS
jgi:hypothetical protein